MYITILFIFLIQFKACISLTPLCGTVTTKSFYGTPTIAYNESIYCKSYAVSYESCLQLLLKSSYCSDAIYINRICYFYDTTFNYYSTIPEYDTSNSNWHVNSLWGIHIHKYIYEFDNCKLEKHYKQSARQTFLQCINTNTDINSILSIDYNKLPYLNIVISVTHSWIERNKEEMERVINHWKCYANTHNYTFTLNIMTDKDAGSFFVSRHESIQYKYLSMSQYTLHIDADSIILNMSKTIDNIINNYPKDVFLFLQMRENYEITSGIYLIKNSYKSRCFLQYWRDMHPPWIYHSPYNYSNSNYVKMSENDEKIMIPVPNHCNGALVSAILLLATPHLAMDCLLRTPYWTSGNVSYNADGFNYGEHRCAYAHRHKIYRLGRNLARDVKGIAVLWHGEGLWRSHEAPLKTPSSRKQSLWYIQKHTTCFPVSDFIGHGDKNIMHHLYMSNYVDKCNVNIHAYHTLKYTTMNNEEKSMILNGAINTKCAWHPLENLLAILRRYCLFSSRYCIVSLDYMMEWFQRQRNKHPDMFDNHAMNISRLTQPWRTSNNTVNICVIPKIIEMHNGYTTNSRCLESSTIINVYKEYLNYYMVK
jgi:hypothetical protein